MGWGAPLGFSSGKSPFERIVSASHGQEGWYLRMSPRPTAEFPKRMLLSTPVARAVFESPEHASKWANHGGELEVLASRYIEHWTHELPVHRTEAGWPNCATCDGGGCHDCTDPA